MILRLSMKKSGLFIQTSGADFIRLLTYLEGESNHENQINTSLTIADFICERQLRQGWQNRGNR